MSTASNQAPGIRLDDKVIMVTGASGTIGAGIVDGLRQAGASVVRQVRSEAEPQLEPQAEPATTTVACDLRQDDAPDRLLAGAIDTFGRIDGLVNNAGIQPVTPFAELTNEQWTEMLDVNLTAAHRLTQAVAQQLGRQSQGGSIIHIASIEARHPTTEHGHYATSKAALVMHAKAAALAYGPSNVRVNAILPGLIDRPGLADDWPDGVNRWLDRAPLARLGTPADVANACLFLLSDLSSWISGAELVVDGAMLTNPTW